MKVMQDYPLVVIHAVIENTSAVGFLAVFTLDPLHLTSDESRQQRAEVEDEMHRWCVEQFGPPAGARGREPGWWHSDWNAFSFDDEVQATAFRVRWG